jgi:hypothetical protein
VQKRTLSKFRISGFAICCAAALVLLHPIVGCSGDEQSATGDNQKDAAAMGETKTETAGPGANAPAVIDGKVIETMNAGRYTYIQVQTSKERIWVAGPVTEVKLGDKVALSSGMLMKDFRSETLDRTFENIYFVPSFNERGTGSTNLREMMMRAHDGEDVLSDHMDPKPGGGGTSGTGGKPVLGREVVGDFDKAPGGHTVEEIYARKTDLAGQTVKVRGLVVKFTPAIMGTNWLHLQDGTGAEGSHDLTVTTSATASVGDLITIQGILAIDKDFGAGYRYEVIVEQGVLIGD